MHVMSRKKLLEAAEKHGDVSERSYGACAYRRIAGIQATRPNPA